MMGSRMEDGLHHVHTGVCPPNRGCLCLKEVQGDEVLCSDTTYGSGSSK